MNKIVSLTLGLLLLFVGIANAKNCLFAYKNINDNWNTKYVSIN